MDKEKLGHYELQSELGRGGMGVVYKANDPTLGREVAIKVLSEALAHDDSVVERFMREAKSMAALNDAHIIQIYYIGEDEGQPFFVMEFVEGESLSQRLKREGKIPPADACRIIQETAAGLALAHSKGVIHRDIKPGNLMITPRGNVKIADFGIAMVQDYSERLTNTGEFVGTPGYLSPEVCVGQEVDHRSDIFALGIVFFEMLTGRIPFTEASPLGMMLEVVKAEIPDVRTMNADVDERTCNILKGMIAKDPADRYQSCEELVADLASDKPVEAPQTGSGPAMTPSAEPSEFQQKATTALSQLEAMPDLAGEVSSSPPPAPAPATMVSVDGGALPAEQPAKKSGGAAMAIAAVLFLGIGAGSLYLFRGTLFGDGEAEADRPQLNVAAPAESTAQQPPAETLSSAVGDEDQELVTNEQLEAELRQLTADPASETGATETAAASQDTPPPVEHQTKQSVAQSTQPVARSMDPSSRQSSQPSTQSSSQSSSQPSSQPAAQPQQLAKATPPPQQQVQVPPPPQDPRIVVVVVGDRAIGGPVEQLLEEALSADDLIVLDEGFFPGIGSVAGEQGVDLPGLSALIQDNGGDVLVLAQIDYIGETPLQYYGQYSTLYSVQLKVRNILLSERRPVGRGYQQKVDFTTLNADQKAREAIEPYLAELTSALRDLKRG